MKAIAYYNYGSPDVLKCEEAEKPAVGDQEVLIRVRAASVNPLDYHMVRGKPLLGRLLLGMGLRRPKDARVGRDVAGHVEEIGNGVTRFKPGDEVFGVCPGAMAEFAVAKEEKLALMPNGKAFEDAAALPVAAITALQALRDKGAIQPGHKVLIDGASGGVGTYAIQIAKALGAEVTAVCSTKKLEIALSLGADHVVDYTKEDFTKNGQRYDMILGANAHHSIFAYKRSLNPAGTYVMVGGGGAQMLQTLLLGPLLSRAGGKKMRPCMAKIVPDDLSFLTELMEGGKLVSHIDRSYPLNDVADAFRYLEEGHASGKVVVTIGS